MNFLTKEQSSARRCLQLKMYRSARHPYSFFPDEARAMCCQA